MNIDAAACVITGASKGLGAALGENLSARQAKVMLSCVDAPALAMTANRLHLPQFVCDVTDRGAVAKLAEHSVETLGAIDVWINNAGIWAPYAEVEDIDMDRAHRIMEVNYFGLAHGSMEAAKRMRAAGKGVIVNILSVRALAGVPRTAMYTASKFAARGFSQSMRAELRGSGVSVMNVYPYRIKTELFGEHKHADYESSMEPAVAARIIADALAQEAPPERLEIWSATDVRSGNDLDS